MHVPIPYFYSSNGSKAYHFPSTIANSSQMSNSDGKSNIRRNTTSPENSSSPINFSSRIQNRSNHLSQSVDDFHAVENSHHSKAMTIEEKQRDQPDEENVEVD